MPPPMIATRVIEQPSSYLLVVLTSIVTDHLARCALASWSGPQADCVTVIRPGQDSPRGTCRTASARGQSERTPMYLSSAFRLRGHIRMRVLGDRSLPEVLLKAARRAKPQGEACTRLWAGSVSTRCSRAGW